MQKDIYYIGTICKFTSCEFSLLASTEKQRFIQLNSDSYKIGLNFDNHKVEVLKLYIPQSYKNVQKVLIEVQEMSFLNEDGPFFVYYKKDGTPSSDNNDLIGEDIWDSGKLVIF